MENRGLSDSALTYLAENESVKIAHLISLELPDNTGSGNSTGYFTDYSRDVIYGGKTYLASRVLSVSNVTESQGIKADKLSIKVAGEIQEELDRALLSPTDNSYINKDLTILRAFIDSNGDIVDFDITGGPMQYFKGQLTDIAVNEGVTSGVSTVTWTAANHFSQFNKVNGRLTQDATHRGLVVVEDPPGTFTEQPDADAAKKGIYTSDLGFVHAETAVDTIAQYDTTEKQLRIRKRGGLAGALGMQKVSEVEVPVTRELEVKYNLSPKYLPIVYGVRRLPTNPVFAGVDSANPKDLYIVYTICEGEIDGILNLYQDNKPVVCSALEEGNETVCVGNQKGGHTIEEVAIGGDGVAAAPTIHGRKYIIEDETGTIEMTAYHGKSDQTADPDLVAVAAGDGFVIQGDTTAYDYWGVDHKLLDTAYIVIKMELSDERQKPPEIEVVVQGKQVDTYYSATNYIPQKEYTLNLAWHLLDYLSSDIYGAQVPLEEIDVDSFSRVAESLEVEDDSYQIAWVPYWRYIGWPDTNSTYVDAHGITRYRRALFQCNTLLNTDEQVFKNIQAMLGQIQGSLTYVGGKYVLSQENDDAVVLDSEDNPTNIDIEECEGSIRTDNGTIKDSWNTIQAGIEDPALGYVQNQIVFFDSVYKKADNNIEKKGRVSFPFITNYYTARSFVVRALRASRFKRTFTLKTYYKYSYLQINDNVEFSYPRFFTDKKLRVSNIALNSDGLVSLTLKEYDPSAFVPDTQTDNSDNQTVPITAVRKPTDVQLSQTLGTVPNQEDASFILDWIPSVSSPVLHYEVKWSMVSTAGDQISTTFTVSPDQLIVGSGRGYFLITGVNPQSSTDDWVMTAQVRTVLSNGSISGWVIKEIDSTGSLYPESLDPVTGFVVNNLVPGTTNEFYSSGVILSWDETQGAQYYEIVVYDPNNEATEYGGFLVANTTFTYTLALNMIDYLAVNGTSSAFRDFKFKIRARSNPDLEPTDPPASWGDSGASSYWTYIEE